MKLYKKLFIQMMIMVVLILISATILVVFVDPFFHYHAPCKLFYYDLNHFDERYINDGITKHFDYDAIITGTSMTQNFKTSELEELFDVKAIKVAYKGAHYKEINDNLKVAFKSDKNIKMVVRGLDMSYFYSEADSDRSDLGVYPTYLYDDVLYNDVKYLFNKDTLFLNTLPIALNVGKKEGGVLSFDNYGYWNDSRAFGIDAVFDERVVISAPVYIEPLTEEQKNVIIDNIRRNVTSIAKENPNTLFYYFITPYSAAWWGGQYMYGWLNRQLESEQIVIEEILLYPNIKLFSYNNCYDITTNMDRYCDSIHYDGETSDWILETMAKDEYLLTPDNYVDYLTKEYEFYSTFDYNSLFY